MSATVTEIENAARRIPVWGWAALAGGAALIVLARHHTAAAALTDPNAAAAALGSGALPGQVYPPGSVDIGNPVTPGTTPDPNQNANTPAAPAETLRDILGTTAAGFIGGLTNAPDYVSITGPTGENITTSNAIGTWGGGGGNPLRSPESEQVSNAFALGWQSNYLNYLQQGWQTFQDAWSRNYAAQLAAAAQIAAAQIAAGQQATVVGLTPGQPAVPAVVCATGDVSCIAAHCGKGDTSCATTVAPWWRGDPVPGWA